MFEQNDLDDLSPQVELLHWGAWAVGALIAVAMFAFIAGYVTVAWSQPVETKSTALPAHLPKGGKR